MEKPVELNPIRLLAKHLVALFCAWLLLPSVTMAAVPPLTSMRAIALPAEVLLSWDEWPDAAFYGVYRANLDRRWGPIAKNVLVPRYRDTDFETLPCYYQVAAFNAAGDLIAFSELLESTLSPLLAGPIGVNPRPVSDTGFAVEWNLGLGLAGDGLLEVGASPTNYEWAASITNFAMRQEFVLTNLQPNTTYFYRITSASQDRTGLSYLYSLVTKP